MWVLQFTQDKCSHLEGLGMTVAFGVRHNPNSKFYIVPEFKVLQSPNCGKNGGIQETKFDLNLFNH